MQELEKFGGVLYREAFDQLSLYQPFVHGTEGMWVGSGSSPLRGIARMMYTSKWVEEFDAWLRYPNFFLSNEPIHLIGRQNYNKPFDPGIISPKGDEFITTVFSHPLTRRTSAPVRLEFDQVKNYEDFLEMVNLQKMPFQAQNKWLDPDDEVRFVTNPRIKGFIGWLDQIPATTVTLVKHADIGTIWSLGVHPYFRKQGLGSETLQFALGTMLNWSDQGQLINEVMLTAGVEHNDFYKKNGFQVVGSLRNQIVVSSLHSV
jgi:ribosomal protein S18 acetylase RimI-like enzyme